MLFNILLESRSHMSRPLRSLALALAISAFGGNAAAGVSVAPDDGCPASPAIEAELERLGVLSSLAKLGNAEVRVEEPSLHVSFRDRRGESLGVRVVTTSPDCGARAVLVAAVIAAFAGDWAQTKLVKPVAPASGQRPSPAAPVGVAASPQSRTNRLWQAEVGAMAFGVHDGDAGTFGLGARADFSRGIWMGSVVIEGSWPRERPLGTGQGAYRFLRAGLGPGIRQRGTHLFWDATLLAMIDRLTLEGRDLLDAHTVSDWEFVVAGTARLGWNGRRMRPFLFVGGSYSNPAQNMTLADSPTRVRLSQANVEAGLGISLGILP